MEIDSEEKDDRDSVFELEEASTIVDEEQTPVVPDSINEASCNKLLNLSSPKVVLASTGVKQTCME